MQHCFRLQQSAQPQIPANSRRRSQTHQISMATSTSPASASNTSAWQSGEPTNMISIEHPPGCPCSAAQCTQVANEHFAQAGQNCSRRTCRQYAHVHLDDLLHTAAIVLHASGIVRSGCSSTGLQHTSSQVDELLLPGGPPLTGKVVALLPELIMSRRGPGGASRARATPWRTGGGPRPGSAA